MIPERTGALRVTVVCLVVAAALSVRADIPGTTISAPSHSPAIYPRLLAAGPDGKVWFSDEEFTPHSVGYYTLSDGTAKVFPIPCPGCDTAQNISYIESITVGPDGNLWLIWTHVRSDGAPLNGGVNSFVSKVTPEGVFTDFPIATKDAFRRYIFAAQGNSMITSGPDGNLWFTENAAYKVGRITTAGVVTEYSLANFSNPSGITTGPDGNLWFTESASKKIGRITPSGVLTEFPIPLSSSQPYAIISASDGNLWFTDRFGRIGRATPSGSITTYELEPQSGASHLAQSPETGKIYFLYATATVAAPGYEGRLARIDPRAASSAHGGLSPLSSVVEYERITLPNGENGFAIIPVARNKLAFTVQIPQPGPNDSRDADRLITEEPVPCPAPARFTPFDTTLPVGTVGEPYPQIDFENADGSTALLTVTGRLPLGLTMKNIGSFKYTLSGTPEEEGRFTISVRRDPYDPRPECQQEVLYTLEIGPAPLCPAVDVSPDFFPPAVPGKEYKFNFSVSPAMPRIDKLDAGWLNVKQVSTTETRTEYEIEGTAPPVLGAGLIKISPSSSRCAEQTRFQWLGAYTGLPSEDKAEIISYPVAQETSKQLAKLTLDFGLNGAGYLTAGPFQVIGRDRDKYWPIPLSLGIIVPDATPLERVQGYIPRLGSGHLTGLMEVELFSITKNFSYSDPVPVAVEKTPSPDLLGSGVFPLRFAEGFQEAFIVPRPLPLPPQTVRATATGTFVATVDNPAFLVTPASGTIGEEIIVTTDTGTLPPGTTSGTLTILESSEGASASRRYPVAMSRIAPVVLRARLIGGDAFVVPVVAHARGANVSEFRSDVRLTNPGAEGAQYRFTFTPTAIDGTTTGRMFTMNVRAGQTVALDDVLRNFYGIGLVGDAGSGSLEIRADTPGATLLATSRTYNFTTSGTLGQFIPAVRTSSFVGRGVVQSLQQVADSAAYRTNVGFVEGKGEPATLAVRIIDGDGTVKATVPVELQPFEHKQINGFIGTNGVKFDDGRIEVEVTSPTGSVTSYASVVDNLTNDPLLVSPAVAATDALSRSVLPGVADLNAGTNFHTDMRVYNPHATATANVTMTYYAQGPGQAGVTKSLSVPPKTVRALDDVLPTFFGVSNTGGSVLVTSSSSRPVVVTGRTYSRAAKGTYGQFIPAVGTAGAAALGGTPLQLTLLEESPAFRTNIGLFEVSGASARVRLTTTVPSGGTPAVIEVDLEPNEFRQIGRFLTQLGIGDAVYNARVSVEVISGNGKVGAYASVVDNKTQDPTYIPAQR